MTPALTVDEIEGERLKSPLGEIKKVLSYRNVRLAVVINFLLLFSEFGIASFLILQLTQEAAMSLAASVVSRTVVGAVSGYVNQHFGFSWNYAVVAAVYLSTLIPVAMIRETAAIPHEA